LHFKDHRTMLAGRKTFAWLWECRPVMQSDARQRHKERRETMPTKERLLYASENGDRWSLCQDLDSGRIIVRHRANLQSGGLVTDVGVGEFLVQGGLGPEKQELLRLIGSLVDRQTTDRS
jgi:hypothetical protein